MLGAAPPAAMATPGRRPDLRKAQARLRKAKVRQYGIVVQERGPGGRTLVDSGRDRVLVPASVAKVVTAAVALDVLGPGYEFVTRVGTRGSVVEGRLDGDLVLQGTGDPTLGEGTSVSEIMEGVTALAAAVRSAGIRDVAGDVVLDDAVFDRSTFHPAWPAGDIVQRYGAGIGGLTFHHGCARLSVTGHAAAGNRARVRALTTTGGLTLKNDVKTVAGARPALSAQVQGDTLRVKGRVPPKGTGVVQVPVPLPQRLVGAAFEQALQRAGVRFSGSVRLVRDLTDCRTDRTLHELRTPLRDVLRAMNVRSQNQYASHVFKAIGAARFGRGTWENAERAVVDALRQRGIGGVDDVRMLDGSGLSIENRITAGVLADLLASFDADALRGPWLYASMATSGVDGTLRKRLRDKAFKGRVHAKTGTLGDVRVRSLMGYVDGRKGHPGYRFVIVLNRGVATHGVIDDVMRALFR